MDWLERTVGELIQFQGGSQPEKTHFRPAPQRGYVRMIQIRDYKSDRFEVYVPQALARRFCNETDIMIGRYGPPVFQILRGLAGAYNVALIKAIPLPDLDPNYAYFFLKSEQLFSFVEKLSRRSSGQTGVDLQELKNYPLPLPPLRSEQAAISAALTDADALIDSLEQLLTKKRQIKQGAMQELLTGKRRLSHAADWHELRLGDVASLKARIGWQGLTTAEYRERGDHLLVTGTEFFGGRIRWDACHYVDQDRYDQDKNIQLLPGDVLVTKDGTIGKAALIDTLPMPATLNSGVFVIRPRNRAFHPGFFYYLLASTGFSSFLSQLSAGSTINHLYQKDFVHFKFHAPEDIEEQRAVFEVLRAIDSEIETIDSRLTKARALKQAMAQALLTGRIRLVEPSA